MRTLQAIDNVIVDRTGWASVTRKNMQALNICYGDLFYLGLDLDEHSDMLSSLYFIKIKNTNDFGGHSHAIEFNKRRQRGGFQLNPILRLLKVSPPFVCEIEAGEKGFDFRLRLPDYKSFSLSKEIHSMLKPIVPGQEILIR